MRYLAIDYGNKRTGVAICDPMEIVVSPLCVLQTEDSLTAKLADIIAEEGVEEIVIGLPLNMDGTEGGQAKKVRLFAEKLKNAVNLPIHFQDERLSSYSAKTMLEPAEMGWRKQKKILDAVAAASILQTFMDAK